MKSRFALVSILLAIPFVLCAQNWDEIRNSGEFFYGVGHGNSEAEATRVAMSEVMNMIAVNVSSDFTLLTDETNDNGEIDHKERIISSLNSISQASLTNVQKWVVDGTAPDYTVRCYIKKDELARIYDGRINKAKDLVVKADEALGKRKLDMALQYYYWAYALVCSLQYPNEVKDEQGRLFITELPMKIREALDGVEVEIVKRDGVYIELLFKYNGEPVSGIGFNFNDGRSVNRMDAKDGIGFMELTKGFDKEFFHIDIEYEHKELARGDAEMNSVLSVITKRNFREANHTLRAPADETEMMSEERLREALNMAVSHSNANEIKSTEASVAKADDYKAVVDRIIEAVMENRYSDVTDLFTLDGLEVFNELVAYGTGRVVGVPDVKIFKSTDGRAVARGLQMAFSFKRGTKTSFVEDVVFTFNKEGKIENVAFGLGKDSTNDIMCKDASGWDDMTREMVMEFLENYKTAYCLKRLDYIETIFSDDAVIITGNVVKRKPASASQNEREISIKGNEIITYNRQTKDEYIGRLKNVFRRNEFINIHFTNNEVQWLEKIDNKRVYAIQIGQEYNSTSYADMGYLFLLVDMTNREEPLIRVRTWQPHETPIEEWYNAGYFFK